jgi:uncharacterized protein YkwD
MRERHGPTEVDASVTGLRTICAAAALVVLAAALVLPAVARPAENRSHVGLTALEAGVLAQLNRIRVAHHLLPLRFSVRLEQAADQHSREMGDDGYFAHSSLDGTAYSTRIADWYPDAGYRHWAVGENLLWSSPNVTADETLRLWMRSPEHRANILTPTWRDIGIAAVHVDAAPGDFGGHDVTIITADFGVRAS